MKNYNNRNKNINNDFNLEKSHRNFGASFSNISNSTLGNYNTINSSNSLTGSKIIKIKNITKKNAKPIYTEKLKEKEKEPLDSDTSSDYGKEEDDDFNNILKESIQSLNISTNKNNNNKLEKITYDKLNEHFNNDIENINKLENKNKFKEDFNTNKSININDYINNGSPREIYQEDNLLKKNKIYNNNNDIINPDSNNNRKELISEEKNEDYKILLKNHNIYVDKKLKEINFFEKLKSISDSRYLFFIKNFRKNNDFLPENSFETILISEKNLKTQSPLTLIFQQIFSPNNPQYTSGQTFFEKNFSLGKNSEYLSHFDKNELNKVPKFFNDITYVNNLFNNFDFDELNNFPEEIKTWKNTFNYEQEYIHQIKYFKQKKKVTLKNNLIIYFISPYDLIIDSHSTSSGIPFSDTVRKILI